MNLRAFGIAAFCLTLSGCGGCTRVSPGYVGVKSTLTGSGRGMSDVAVGPAWVYYNAFTESVMEYPTFMQTAVWTHNKDEGHPINEEITFTTSNKMQVAADISIGYTLKPERVPAFYIKFRSDDVSSFTHGYLRNMARQQFDDVAGRYTVDQIMGDNGPFLKEVRAALQHEMDSIGVFIEQFGFIGAPRPPQGVIDSINATVQAAQLALQKQNELVSSQADAAKAVAKAEGEARSVMVNAEAQAKANRILAESITQNLIEYRKLDKWNGALPQVSGSGGGVLLQLK